MNFATLLATAGTTVLAAAALVLILFLRRERKRLGQAKERLRRAATETAIARAILLRFPDDWAAPLRARRCLEKAIETLEEDKAQGGK